MTPATALDLLAAWAGLATGVAIAAFTAVLPLRRERDVYRARSRAYAALCRDQRCRLEERLFDFTEHARGRADRALETQAPD